MWPPLASFTWLLFPLDLLQSDTWAIGIKRRLCSLQWSWLDLRWLFGLLCWLGGRTLFIGRLLMALLWRKLKNFTDLCLISLLSNNQHFSQILLSFEIKHWFSCFLKMYLALNLPKFIFSSLICSKYLLIFLVSPLKYCKMGQNQG